MNDYDDGVLIEPWNVCGRCYSKRIAHKKIVGKKIMYGTICPVCKLETIFVVTDYISKTRLPKEKEEANHE